MEIVNDTIVKMFRATSSTALHFVLKKMAMESLQAFAEGRNVYTDIYLEYTADTYRGKNRKDADAGASTDFAPVCYIGQAGNMKWPWRENNSIIPFRSNGGLMVAVLTFGNSWTLEANETDQQLMEKMTIYPQLQKDFIDDCIHYFAFDFGDNVEQAADFMCGVLMNVLGVTPNEELEYRINSSEENAINDREVMDYYRHALFENEI